MISRLAATSPLRPIPCRQCTTTILPDDRPVSSFSRIVIVWASAPGAWRSGMGCDRNSMPCASSPFHPQASPRRGDARPRPVSRATAHLSNRIEFRPHTSEVLLLYDLTLAKDMDAMMSVQHSPVRSGFQAISLARNQRVFEDVSRKPLHLRKFARAEGSMGEAVSMADMGTGPTCLSRIPHQQRIAPHKPVASR